MLVVDSSAWVEFFKDSAIGKQVAQMILTEARLVVPTIVALEVAKWALRELTPDVAQDVFAALHERETAILDFDIALLAADTCRFHRLATADAIVYATAQAMGAKLLTCDSHFKDLPGVVYFAKD